METFALSVVKRLPKTRTALTVYPIRPQRRSLNVLGFHTSIMKYWRKWMKYLSKKLECWQSWSFTHTIVHYIETNVETCCIKTMEQYYEISAFIWQVISQIIFLLILDRATFLHVCRCQKIISHVSMFIYGWLVLKCIRQGFISYKYWVHLIHHECK